jgi:hypothetical protein
LLVELLEPPFYTRMNLRRWDAHQHFQRLVHRADRPDGEPPLARDGVGDLRAQHQIALIDGGDHDAVAAFGLFSLRTPLATEFPGTAKLP